jgi:hypothetical protein
MRKMVEARQLQNETPICLLACTLRESKQVKQICWVPPIPPGVLQRKKKSKRKDE